MSRVYPSISYEKKFYGYVAGVQTSTNSDGNARPLLLLAAFEYGGVLTTYTVPDLDLFKILCSWVYDNAREISETDGTIGKVWIEYRDGQWVVELP